MLNSNHQNLTCEFAEEIVSYLYNEMVATEKARFEAHLGNCSFCADEVASFGLVRSEIVNWKDEIFVPLATPIIEIPFEQSAKPLVIKEVSRPWYATVRDYFSLSPVWMTATTAMAVLAICAGLVFVTINSLRDSGNVVVQDNTTIKPISSPTTEVKKVENADSNPILPKNDSRQNSSTPPTVLGAPKSAPATTKITERQIVKLPNITVKKNSATTNKVTKTIKRNSAPSLVGDEDEDDSLRLSDIFSEIGSR